jgi:hypothetical protein
MVIILFWPVPQQPCAPLVLSAPVVCDHYARMGLFALAKECTGHKDVLTTPQAYKAIILATIL